MGFPWLWHIFGIYSNSPQKVKGPWNNYLDCPASGLPPENTRTLQNHSGSQQKQAESTNNPGIILVLVGLGWCVWGFPGCGIFLVFIPTVPRRSKAPGIIISTAQLAAFPQKTPEPAQNHSGSQQKQSESTNNPGIILVLVGLGWCVWGFPGCGIFLVFIPTVPRRSKTPGIIISAAQLAAIFPQNPPEPAQNHSGSQQKQAESTNNPA